MNSNRFSVLAGCEEKEAKKYVPPQKRPAVFTPKSSSVRTPSASPADFPALGKSTTPTPTLSTVSPSITPVSSKGSFAEKAKAWSSKEAEEARRTREAEERSRFEREREHSQNARMMTHIPSFHSRFSRGYSSYEEYDEDEYYNDDIEKDAYGCSVDNKNKEYHMDHEGEPYDGHESEYSEDEQ